MNLAMLKIDKGPFKCYVTLEDFFSGECAKDFRKMTT